MVRVYIYAFVKFVKVDFKDFFGHVAPSLGQHWYANLFFFLVLIVISD